jgi:hypothetical protein
VGESTTGDYVAGVERRQGAMVADRQELALAGIRDALLNARVALAESRPGCDPYNSRLGRSSRSSWDLARRR